ncbi:MAG: hypothetical protein ABI794_16700 [Betaproteobacteria bacterium]
MDSANRKSTAAGFGTRTERAVIRFGAGSIPPGRQDAAPRPIKEPEPNPPPIDDPGPIPESDPEVPPHDPPAPFPPVTPV